MINHTYNKSIQCENKSDSSAAGALGKYTESRATLVSNHQKYALKKLASTFLSYKRPIEYTDLDGIKKPLLDQDDNPITEMYRARVCSCGKVPKNNAFGVAENISITKNPVNGNCKYSGMTTCGNIWTCPVCADSVAYQRVTEIQNAMKQNREKGGSCLFWTQTFPHTKNDSLKDGIDILSTSSTKLKANSTFKRLMKKHGIFGSIFALEITFGYTNGWHPHRHTILFSDRLLTAIEIENLRLALSTLWIHTVDKYYSRTPDLVHGSDLRAADYDTDSIASYMAKWSKELVETGIKQARGDNFTYLDMLLKSQEQYSFSLVKLIREYEQSTSGRARLYWSRGLKDIFNIVEISDEQLADSPEKELVTLITFQEYLSICKAGMEAHVLNVARDYTPQIVKELISEIHHSHIETLKHYNLKKRDLYLQLEKNAERHLFELGILLQ